MHLEAKLPVVVLKLPPLDGWTALRSVEPTPAVRRGPSTNPPTAAGSKLTTNTLETMLTGLRVCLAKVQVKTYPQQSSKIYIK